MVILPKSIHLIIIAVFSLIVALEIAVAGSISVAILWLLFSVWVALCLRHAWKAHKQYW